MVRVKHMLFFLAVLSIAACSSRQKPATSEIRVYYCLNWPEGDTTVFTDTITPMHDSIVDLGKVALGKQTMHRLISQSLKAGEPLRVQDFSLWAFAEHDIRYNGKNITVSRFN